MKTESHYIKNLKKDIVDSYLFLRKNNESIPSESLEFMKDAALFAANNGEEIDALIHGIDGLNNEIDAIKNPATVVKKYGCHVELLDDEEPDECVHDTGKINDCIHAVLGVRKEDCKYWHEIGLKADVFKADGAHLTGVLDVYEQIEKLIAEYRSKIELCDNKLNELTNEEQRVRGLAKPSKLYLELISTNIREQHTLRQSYVQFIADLESLSKGE